MNQYQTKLYDELLELVHSNKSFSYKDHEIQNDNGEVECYRVFTYNLIASYTRFHLPGALECRGIMYEMSSSSDNKTPLRLASHPMEKFFNLNENPLTTNLDLSKVDLIEDKADGSLISTYVMNFRDSATIGLKSKASLGSDQAVASTKWLKQPEQVDLQQELTKFAADTDYTVNMEWVSPENQIVVGYAKSELRILNIRSNQDGSYLDYENLPAWATQVRERWTARVNLENHKDDMVAFVNSIPTMKNVEGFVIRLKDSGMRVKIKTDWYLNLHKHNSFSSPPTLFQAVLDEITDDLKAKFSFNEPYVDRIIRMEDLVRTHYQDLETEITDFYVRHQDLSQKAYAITARRSLNNETFRLAMSMYNGRPVPYKACLLNRRQKILERHWP